MSARTVGTDERRRWAGGGFFACPWLNLVAAFVLLALIQGFLVKVYQVPSASMEPTLQSSGLNSDRFLVNRLAYISDEPKSGDVIVFNADDDWEVRPERSATRQIVGAIGDVVGFGPSNHYALVKRVIAGPGDTVSCCGEDGRITVNDVALEEPYVLSDFEYATGQIDCATVPQSLRCFPTITVPDDQYLVLGDNRSNSADSLVNCRGSTENGDCARFIDSGDIVGKALVVAYPFNRWGQHLSFSHQVGVDQ